MPVSHRLLIALSVLLLGACTQQELAMPTMPERTATGQQTDPATQPARPFVAQSITVFDEPWAMAFLPDGRLLVTEKRGTLRLFDPASGKRGDIAGVPSVAYGGQGGLGDVVLHPQYPQQPWVYLSYVEEGAGNTRGAVVARAKLVLDDDGGGKLDALQIIWQQTPKVSGNGHYSHRIAFGPDGHVFISSGDRQKFDPAQDMRGNLGKILRLNADGSVPADNPFAAQGGVAAQVWSLGHRNPLGLAFDATGQLWGAEMGPEGGDELNRIELGHNYGWPIVSNGDHYDGTTIPDHATRPEFHAPAIHWTPVISPSSLLFYDGALFPAWKGSALLGGLSSQALVRVSLQGERGLEIERFAMGARIRALRQGPDGALWLLQDGSDGKLLKLTPAR